MMPKYPIISVLLTCHNRKAKTLTCLESVFSQAGLNVEFGILIFLVDDGSDDGTTAAVAGQYPEVNIIPGDGHLFWNRGMHLAWKVASEQVSADYFLWVNDDTYLLEGALKEMIDCLQCVNHPVIVCGATSSKLENKFSYGGSTVSGDSIIPNGEIQYCEIMHGNCVLVPTEVFKLNGNLDPVFPHAIGDHDYGLRYIELGGQIITTRCFIGHCESNEKLPKWCYSSTPILERFRTLYSPLGYSHPRYFFIYENRHFGLFVALKHYFSIHLRALVPSLWK
jgi:GT2 family glycosyltransferase